MWVRCPVDKLPGIHVQPEVVDIGRHFGTGVIVATAFIHMLVGSLAKLQSHHLPSVIGDFPSFGAAVALAAIFAMHLVETMFVSHGEPYSGLHMHLPTMGRKKATTFILELGILSHSIFVGLSLGLKKSHKFFPLLVAICFHQFFEGVGLGARIAEMEFERRNTPFLMVMAYSVTTSIGIVMGIIVHGTYDPHSPTAIVAEGCLDAISAGILIYTGLVELMGRDLSNDSDFGTKPSKTKTIYLASLYFGALAMTIVALWA
ncbi:hypothetical protein DSO57_1024481 [Entomophthora muscae]|uniref:Uncharacterized protein n=1 Tax=Entomophthora muscae TaxID=34485 RepID=A0ACC2TQ54_9FUNG|nr:hypothetical protein DSO57_1024481 [Entomophthora muscae]